MRPFKLAPAFKDYIWGGDRLKSDYNKQFDGDILAESWEVSAHPDGPSIIAGGEFAGMTLGEFAKRFPQSSGDFPILIKFIDSAAPLSIQVHPGDAYARQHDNDSGKTELWYILDSSPGAYIYYGFRQPTRRADMERGIAEGSITDMLRKVEVQKGDVFFIPAGTIHAIGPGLIIAEVQQSSNSTYRVFDFGRLDAQGNPRPLHIQKALDVTDLQPANQQPPGAGRLAECGDYVLDRLAACGYFTADSLKLHGRYQGEAEGFVALACLGGEMELACDEADAAAATGAGEAPLKLAKGDSAFVPVGTGRFALCGSGECLLVSKPE